jgi:hypothetical protein
VRWPLWKLLSKVLAVEDLKKATRERNKEEEEREKP